jgi:RNA polymerase sigma-70 factor, ECF subfamily
MVSTRSDVADDEHLAEIIGRRDENARAMVSARDALGQLYTRHAPLLLAFLSGRRRHEADDLHQEVWRKVWVHLPTKFRGGLFKAWLYQIARHTLIDASRKKSSQPLGDEPVVDTRQPAVDSGLIEVEQNKVLQRCLESLDEAAAQLVRARLGGMSYEEICERIKMTKERAQRLFHTIKIKLQTCVERALG